MGYSSLSDRVVADVIELNRRYLSFAATPGNAAPAELAGWQRELASVTPAARERLAQAPYLLVDVEAVAMEPTPAGNLFDQRGADVNELWLLTLGYCRQLARRELFRLRVVSGAGDDWCRRLAELSLARLADRIRDGAPWPLPALASQSDWWSDYIAAAVDGESGKLIAVRMAGLQHRLCRAVDDTPLGIAACKLDSPSRRIAGRRLR